MSELKEWACAQLTQHLEATLPVLLEARNTNPQLPWITGGLGQQGRLMLLSFSLPYRSRVLDLS